MNRFYNKVHKEIIPNMPEIAPLVPRLKISVPRQHKKLQTPLGPAGRINRIRMTLTALFKYERIESRLQLGLETRGYAERLILEAIQHGDTDAATMDLADFWLDDKQMIHKLFNVLVPRFKDYTICYTNVHHLPTPEETPFVYRLNRHPLPFIVMELRGNPFPPMPKKRSPNSFSLTNVLLREAHKDHLKQKCEAENSTA